MAATPARRLRVAYIDHVARLSGGELALLRTLPALLGRVDPIVILGEDGPLRTRLENLGIEVRVLPLTADLRDTPRSGVLSSAARPGEVAALGRYVLALRRLLRSERVELVHTNSLKAALYGGVAGRLAGLPVLWHVRDRLSVDYLTRSTALMVRAAARTLPTAVVANSRATLETLPRSLTARVLLNPVVPDAVDRNNVPSIRGEGTFRVGLIGRLSPWKGQDVFLRAFAHAFAGEPVMASIIGSAMFGEDEYAASLPGLAEELGISAQVNFAGFREDVWAELAALDVLVHASTVPEPFGQVVLEGLAAGVPVVASAEGGPAEILTHDVDGLLVRPRDPKELARALIRLRHDPDLRQRLASAGESTALRYSPASTAAALLEVYDSLAPGRRQRVVSDALSAPAGRAAEREQRESIQLRVLLVGMSPVGERPGGGNRYLHELRRALDAAGVTTQTLLLSKGPVGEPTVTSVGHPEAAVLTRMWCFAREIARHADDIDVLNTHFALYGIGASFSRKGRRLPLVVNFQGPWAREAALAEGASRSKVLLLRRLERAHYRRADRLITLSHEFADVLVAEYGVARQRITVIPPGVNLDHFTPGSIEDARKRLGLRSDGFVGVAVRRLTARMGLEQLIEAWASLPAGARLLIAGEGPERQRLEELIRRLDVGDSVTLLGRVSDEQLPDLYRAANVSLVPTVALEGFGLIVLESLASGTPVIATRTGGMSEVLPALSDDLLVPPGDISALKSRIQRAWDDPGSLPEARQCRRFAQRYRWSTQGALVADVLRAAASRKPRP